MTAFLPIGYRLTFQDHPGEYVITSVIGRGASTIVYATEYHNGTYRVLKASGRVFKTVPDKG